MEIRSDGERRTILLHDYHGEYTGTFGDNNSNLAETTPNNSTIWGDCELYWNSFGIEGALQDIFGYDETTAERQMRNLMQTMLPPPFIEHIGLDQVQSVWRLTGKADFMEMKFNQLCDALKVDYVSGDDDAFDYWPNTMDMLWDFACDLDAEGSRDHRDRVHAIAKAVFEGTTKRDGHEWEADRRELFIQEWGLDVPDRDNETWSSWFLEDGKG